MTMNEDGRCERKLLDARGGSNRISESTDHQSSPATYLALSCLLASPSAGLSDTQRPLSRGRRLLTSPGLLLSIEEYMILG